jgi:CheY-like chemotaxis protein
LFTPFTQADSSTTRRFGGTGLGLYISKQLAQMLGGSVDIKSMEGLGTRVEVTVATGDVGVDDLIYADLGHEPGPHPTPSSRPQADAVIEALRGRVLLAEDSPDNQRLISRYIRKTGADVVIAQNGRIAVEQALSDHFDLILMDMQMPLMDGIEATQLLRRAGYPGPIVALTANAFREDRERCADAGCNDFLTKPVDRTAFQRTLAKYLAQASEAEAGSVDDSFADDLYDLAADFVGKLPKWIVDMRAAHTAGETQTLTTLVHQLKGLGGTFGYPEITRHAQAINRQLHAGDTEDLASDLDDLYGACEQAIDHFARHRAKSA